MLPLSVPGSYINRQWTSRYCRPLFPSLSNPLYLFSSFAAHFLLSYRLQPSGFSSRLPSAGTCCFTFVPIIGPALRSLFKSEFRTLLLCIAACTVVSVACYFLRLHLLDFFFGTFTSRFVARLPFFLSYYAFPTHEASSLTTRCGVYVWLHLVCFE